MVPRCDAKNLLRCGTRASEKLSGAQNGASELLAKIFHAAGQKRGEVSPRSQNFDAAFWHHASATVVRECCIVVAGSGLPDLEDP